MQETRRAQPPRPSLLVGDLQGCEAAFEALQAEVLQLQLQESTSLSDSITTDASAWERLVPRCRSIRETLTSVHELSDFTRQVYETSADICMRAGDMGEALKCLRQLVELIYVTLAASELQGPAQQPASAERGVTRAGHRAGEGRRPAGGFAAVSLQRFGLLSSSAATAGAAAGAGAGYTAPKQPVVERPSASGNSEQLATALEIPQFARWPEMAAALLLYYKCHQRQEAEGIDTIITLRRLPAALVRRKEVQLALHMMVAMAGGDCVTFFRLLDRAPLMVQLVVHARVPQVRQHALACLAAAYRNIETAAVARMLGLTGPAAGQTVLKALKELADREHRGAQIALSNAQTGNDAIPQDLVFK